MTDRPELPVLIETMSATTQTTEADRLAQIKARLTAVPPGQWSWHGNTDYPEQMHLATPGWRDADGYHFGTTAIGLVKHELTERDARLAGVGDLDFFPPPEFMPVEQFAETFDYPKHPGDAEDAEEDADGAIYSAEYEKALDEAYETAHEAHIEAHRAEVIRDWLTDDYDQRRSVYRLAFTDERSMLVEADKLAIFEVAPNSTNPDDPQVYRCDIVGFRHPVAEFMATASTDIAHLVAEVEHLRAQLAAASIATVRVLSSTGHHRHLGAVEWGLRTACGRKFDASKTNINVPGASGSLDVTCQRCMATSDYTRAVASGQITDMRATATALRVAVDAVLAEFRTAYDNPDPEHQRWHPAAAHVLTLCESIEKTITPGPAHQSPNIDHLLMRGMLDALGIPLDNLDEPAAAAELAKPTRPASADWEAAT